MSAPYPASNNSLPIDEGMRSRFAHLFPENGNLDKGGIRLERRLAKGGDPQSLQLTVDGEAIQQGVDHDMS